MNEESSSLFDLSRESAKKLPKAKPPPKKEPGFTLSNEEVFEILRYMKDRHTKIVQELEEAFRKSGIAPDELARYCENPNNFTPLQWESYKRAKAEVVQSITGMSAAEIQEKQDAKDKKHLSKDRRGKTLGSRKNWLNMH